ncbi:MAG: hypothetical protein KAJ28_03265 [Flavobacteriaceae bacterium]|nr:hypothetical protein [Flavobacteriaceae bacterium]
MNEYEQQKSWFGRNWLWVVPVGGCLTIILLLVFGAGAIFFGVTSVLKNSTPYEYAIEQASTNIIVIEFLGEPIETYGIMQGKISLNDDSGKVDIKIPIKGPKGEGSVTVKGEKIENEWIYEELYVLIKETNERINLLDKVLEGI